MQEIWKSLKDIVDYGESYEVSNYGRVRSIDRMSFNGHSEFLRKGKILKQQNHTEGYLKVLLSSNGKKKYYYVHQLVALAFIPNPENKETVNHKDTNKKNNHVDNLEWKTLKENLKHATDNELTSYSKMLNAKEVADIINLWSSEKYTQKEIAEIYNVSHSLINKIINGGRHKYADYKNNRKNKKQVKLSDLDKDKIRELYKTKEYTQKEIGELFGVGQSRIQTIVNR